MKVEAPRFRGPALTDEEQRTFVNHINTKWATKTCSFCNANNWEIGGWTNTFLGDGSGAMVIGGAVLPGIALVCMNCGFMVTVNAIVAGLHPRGK